MPPHIDPTQFDERIEALTAALETAASAETRELAKALVGLVLEFHKAGVSRIVSAVADDDRIRARLAGDPLVTSLLALHDLPLAPPPPLIQISRGPGRKTAGADPLPIDHGGVCARCGAVLPRDHRHAVDLESRLLSCRCYDCWLLAGASGESSLDRRVPDRYRVAPGFELAPSEWDALQVPVDVAFLMRNSRAGRTIAFYPGPAGATESALDFADWDRLSAANPWMRTIEPDVEALLVRRDGRSGTCSSFIVPVDACYELVGRLRLSWSGLTGGPAVDRAIDAFFAELSLRCGERTPAGVRQ